jgi:hypothetical protein
MSIGVKEVLIKSVAQVTPTYIMGVLKLPDKRMTQLICKFWWGGERTKESPLDCMGQIASTEMQRGARVLRYEAVQ